MKKTVLYRLCLFLLSTSATYAMPFSFQIDANAPSDHVRSIGVNFQQPGNIIIVTQEGTAFYSMDYGDHWNSSVLPAGLGMEQVHQDRSGDARWIGTASDGSGQWFCISSQDSGKNFLSIGSIPVRFDMLAASELIPGLSLGASYQDQAIYRSQDGGATWNRTPALLSGNDQVCWHPTAAWIAYCGKNRSSDYGQTWELLSVHGVFAAGYGIPTDLFAAEDEALFISHDDLFSWVPLIPQPCRYVSVNPRNPLQIYAGTTTTTSASPERASLYFSSDAGATFNLWNNGLPQTIAGVFPVADWITLVVSEGKLYRYDIRRADLDGNQRIDGGDLIILSLAFGSSTTDGPYNPAADLNSDGVIDGQDLIVLATVWGQNFKYQEKKPGGDF